jgi:hypothetical protein
VTFPLDSVLGQTMSHRWQAELQKAGAPARVSSSRIMNSVRTMGAALASYRVRAP